MDLNEGRGLSSAAVTFSEFLYRENTQTTTSVQHVNLVHNIVEDELATDNLGITFLLGTLCALVGQKSCSSKVKMLI